LYNNLYHIFMIFRKHAEIVPQGFVKGMVFMVLCAIWFLLICVRSIQQVWKHCKMTTFLNHYLEE